MLLYVYSVVCVLLCPVADLALLVCLVGLVCILVQLFPSCNAQIIIIIIIFNKNTNNSNNNP